MVGVAEARGFLSRWSQRKVALAKGEVLTEPLPPLPLPPLAPPVLPDAPQAHQEPVPPAPVELPPPLTLDDVKLLTAESDFAPFMARSVTPEVKNAAMKKLFTDPHYNVMDRLDIYIDDYSLPDPLPESMLRQMASAKFLKLFDETEDTEKVLAENAALPRDDADGFVPADVAHSTSVPESLSPSEPAAQPSHFHNADPHLRLQPDHAIEPETPRDRAA